MGYLQHLPELPISETGVQIPDPQMARMAILRFQAPEGVAYIFGDQSTISGPTIWGSELLEWGEIGVFRGSGTLGPRIPGWGRTPDHARLPWISLEPNRANMGFPGYRDMGILGLQGS